MKNLLLLLILVFSASALAQVDPTVTLDPTTRNYIIRYQGHEGEDQNPAIVERIFEPSTKINPHVNARVSKDSLQFRYTYGITNDIASMQRIIEFDVKVVSNPGQVTGPSDSWRFSSFSFAPIFGWYSSKGEAGLSDSLDGIAPGSTEEGFSFSSDGLPGFVNSYLRGKPSSILSFPDEPPGEIARLLKPLRKFPNNTVIRRTLGPVSPPAQFIPLAFLDTLISYKHQAFALGWIREEGIVTSLDAKLEAVRPQIIADRPSAKNILQSFINELDALNSQGDQITSEAYALLKFNAQYLMSKL
ncbi:MAG: hypothetical protein WEF53_01970 [Bacteroidota bacterium]